MSADRTRRRELGYLVLRFPVGVATSVLAVTALAVPVVVASAPFAARRGVERPFGDWAGSGRIEDIASSSPWSWLLVPLGLVLLIGSFHLMNAVARACARWAAAWLAGPPRTFDER
jgi:hypothetical protein